uniref:Uncharacterized protein n=1 Tax=Desertifilum tharense IPPAS B-1220 TaxID=1781255 RepID=A0ACD5H194_9CYAN
MGVRGSEFRVPSSEFRVRKKGIGSWELGVGEEGNWELGVRGWGRRGRRDRKTC